MKGIIFCCLLILSSTSGIQAFGTQDELEWYLKSNPNPTEFHGTLEIYGSVHDLSGLTSLRRITGDLIIHYTEWLKSAAALDSLDFIGGEINFTFNDSLEVLPTLSVLKGSTRSITITDNPLQTSYPTFQNLHEVKGQVHISRLPLLNSLESFGSLHKIAGDLIISECATLKSIVIQDSFLFGGFQIHITSNPELRSIHGISIEKDGPEFISIRQNHSLDTLNAFNGFNGENSHIRISDNGPMKYIMGFSGVKDLSSITINDNKNLLHFSAFQYLDQAKTIEFYNNSALISISGFENLYSIRHLLNMYNNESLIDIEGFENITWYGDVRISMNSMLSDCAIQSICRHLSFESSTYVLAENNEGCNSKLEILNSCMTSTEDASSVINQINITQQAINFNKSYSIHYQIFSVNGVLVESGNHPQSVSIIDYLPGVYLLKLPEYAHSQLFVKN